MLSKKAIKVEGVVLKRMNYRDSDRILTLYTKELGKITALAKGVRKMTSKKRGHIEPLTYANLYLIKTGDWYLTTQTESIKIHRELRNNEETLRLAILVLEALDKITEKDEQSEILFRLIVKTLDFVESKYNAHITAAYLIKLLKISGLFDRGKLLEFKTIVSTDTSKIMEYFKILENLTFEKICQQIDNQNFDNKVAYETINTLVSYFNLYADIKLKSLDVGMRNAS